MTACPETMVSQAVENHTHTCGADLGKHHTADDDHFCTECGRWWWKKWQQEEL